MNSMHLRLRLGPLHLQADATLDRGITLVSGENGAGKTTLLRSLAGLENAEGHLMVSGEVWLDSVAGFFLPVEQRSLGCVWTDTALLPWLNVQRNIMLGNSQVDPDWLNRLVNMLEISTLMQRRPYMLSTGEAQRVSLARALLRKPKLLLLDEALSAQAPAIRQRLREVLKILQREMQMIVVMASHDVEDVRILAERHWHMCDGRLLGSLEDMIGYEEGVHA